MAIPEIGQQAARELYSATQESNGEAVLEIAPDVARDLATACSRLVDELRAARLEGQTDTFGPGFGALPSGRALARGFSGKASEFAATLTAFQEAALLLEAAFLAAGKQFAEADAANHAALRLVAGDDESRR
ncbi:hypothetical protein [Nocardia sp. alder85J]|uniref:hypothetical protein n=1 Tax=Nocardia sp. alder85J TaxID=2862949 RepID=UPI001CD331B1|nr:hypothetical protein [Nocardia sp. alder85J]MCX4098826.1 hypothetical protein [Nocardia sp. alder85J]